MIDTTSRSGDDSQLPSRDIVFNINEFRSGYLFGSNNPALANKDKGAFSSAIDTKNNPGAVDRVALSGNVSPAGDVFFAFTTPNGDISEAYGHIDIKSRCRGSIVLKDVVTGEIVGDANLVGRSTGIGKIDRNFDCIVGSSSHSRSNSSIAKSVKLAVNGSSSHLTSLPPFMSPIGASPESIFTGSDSLARLGALRSALDPVMMPQQSWHD